jgi:hypothetical protein
MSSIYGAPSWCQLIYFVIKLLDHVATRPNSLFLYVYFNANFNILKQIGCALVGLIKDWIVLKFNVFCTVHCNTIM